MVAHLGSMIPGQKSWMVLGYGALFDSVYHNRNPKGWSATPPTLVFPRRLNANILLIKFEADQDVYKSVRHRFRYPEL